MKNYVIAFLFLTLVSCNGGSDSSTSTASQSPTASIDPLDSQFDNVINSAFIDDPVEGLIVTKLSSGDVQSTGDGGKFTCTRGEELQFTFGNVILGKSYCDHKVFLAELEKSRRTDFLASLIQSMSSKTQAGDLSYFPGSYGQLSSVDLDSDEVNFVNSLQSAIATIKAGISSPGGRNIINYVSPATASASMYASMGVHGALNEKQISSISDLLVEGDQTITLYSTSRVNGACLPSIDINYNINKSSYGHYRFTINNLTSSSETDSFQPTIKIASQSASKIYKIISRPSFYAKTSSDVTSGVIESWLRSKFLNPFIFIRNLSGQTIPTFQSETTIKMWPKENDSLPNLELTYKSLSIFYQLGDRYEMKTDTCTYQREVTNL